MVSAGSKSRVQRRIAEKTKRTIMTLPLVLYGKPVSARKKSCSRRERKSTAEEHNKS